MNNPIFIFSLDSIIECWFDYYFFKNYTFHKSTSEFCFFFFFCKSRVRGRASSEVQTPTNCYMYAILPVISATDLTSWKTRWSNWGQCMCGDWWISILGLCQFLCVCGLSILAVTSIKGNKKRNRKRSFIRTSFTRTIIFNLLSRSFVVSQIVGCPVIRLLVESFVLLEPVNKSYVRCRCQLTTID